MSLEDRINELEKEVQELVKRIEQSADAIGRNIDDEIEGPVRMSCRSDSKGGFLGVMLIVAGIIWLSSRMDWFQIDIPFWPIFMIVFGLLIIYNGRKR